MVRRPPSSTLFPDPTLFRYPMVATAPAREAAIPKPAALPSFVPAASPKSVPPRPTPRPPGTPAYVRPRAAPFGRSEEHTSELQSHLNLVCRLLLEKKNKQIT